MKALDEGRERERRPQEQPPQHHDDKLKLAATLGNQAFASLARSSRQRTLQRFVESEHKLIGDLGSTKGPVVVPPELELAPGVKITYGDMVAMGGDWFESVQQITDLAKIPGPGPGTREEVEYVLTVEIHGKKDKEEDFLETTRKAAKARYYKLAASNPSHFLNPRDGDTSRTTEERVAASESGKPMGAGANYHSNHRNALIEAARLGQAKQPINGALLLEAFGNHFLTDSFSSGHLRTPRQTLAEEWHAKVPMFFTNFKMFMAERIAKYINDHNWRGALTVDTLMFKGEGVFPAGSMPTIEATLRDKQMPPITFGDIVSGALHDYDNQMGVDADVDGKRVKLFGDSQLGKPHGADTLRLASEAVRASLDEVEEAYAQGWTPQQFLDRNGGLFAAEHMLPHVAPELEQDHPQVSWRYDNVNDLLADPLFKKAVAITARDKATELQGIGDDLDAEYTRDAFNNGFLVKLQGSDDQIAATLQEVIDYTPDTGGGVGGHVEDSNAEDYFNDVKARGALHTLTLPAKQRLVEHVLTGATLGSEDAMIVELLAANVDDGVKIIKHFGWRWIWDDVDGDDCRDFITKLGPAYWATRDVEAKKREIAWLADGPTSEIEEETIMIILRTCTRAEVIEIDKAIGLDWDLDGVEQDEFDRMKA